MLTMADDIRCAVRVLRQGGVIVYPTDTIWGIGCDATNPSAVARVYAIKQRAASKSLLCLVDSAVRLQRYARSLSPVAWDLLTLSTTPTTVILDGITGLAPAVYAADGSVGIRLPLAPFPQQLCYAFEKPIVSTSANLSGAPAPSSFSEIDDAVLSAADYVCTSLRAPSDTPCRPSAVVRLHSDGTVVVLRQ